LGHKLYEHNDRIAEHNFPETDDDVKYEKLQCLPSLHQRSDSLGIETMSTKQSDESYVSLCENSNSVLIGSCLLELVKFSELRSNVFIFLWLNGVLSEITLKSLSLYSLLQKT
jgi:hypothetical protein